MELPMNSGIVMNGYSSHRNLELPPVPMHGERYQQVNTDHYSLPFRRMHTSVYPQYSFSGHTHFKKRSTIVKNSTEEPVYASVRRSNSSSEACKHPSSTVHTEDSPQETSEMPYYASVVTKTAQPVYSNSSRKSSLDNVDEYYSALKKTKVFPRTEPSEPIYSNAKNKSKNQPYNECYSQEGSIYATCANDRQATYEYSKSNNSEKPIYQAKSVDTNDTLSSTYARRALGVMNRLLKRLHLSSSGEEGSSGEGQHNVVYNPGSEEYSGQYRGLIARESIASLRARNAMPLVMFADLPPIKASDNYESVPQRDDYNYSYPRRRATISEEPHNESHSADGVHGRHSSNLRTPANDSDAYAEIFDSSVMDGANNGGQMYPLGYVIPNTASNVYTTPMVATPQMQHYLQSLSHANVGSTLYPMTTTNNFTGFRNAPTPLTINTPLGPPSMMLQESPRPPPRSRSTSFSLGRFFSRIKQRGRATPAPTNCHTPASLSFTQHPLGTPNNQRFDCNSISSRRSSKLGRAFKRLFMEQSPRLPSNSTLPPLPLDPVRPPLSMTRLESVYDKPKLPEDPVEGLFLAEIQEFRHVDSEVDVRRASGSGDRTPLLQATGNEYEDPKPVNQPLLLQQLDDEELSRSGCLSLPSVTSNNPNNLAASSQNTLRASSNYVSPMEAEREERGARITHSSTYEDLVLSESQDLP